MMSNILRAIKDWSAERFQIKGDYLTEVPEGYVTTSDLEESYLGGIKFGKDENGNPGYYKFDESVGADTLVPFKIGGNGGSLSELSIPIYLPLRDATYSSVSSYKFLHFNNLNGLFNGVKKIKVVGSVNGRLTTGTSERTIGISFSYHGKKEDGTMDRSYTFSVGKISVNSTSTKYNPFVTEIDFDADNVFFDEIAGSANNPNFYLSLGGTNAAGSGVISGLTLYYE